MKLCPQSWLAAGVVGLLGLGHAPGLPRPRPVEPCSFHHSRLHVVPGVELGTSVRASVDCVRHVLRVEGQGGVWGLAGLQVTVDGAPADVGIQQDRLFWAADLPASGLPYLHGHWQSFQVVATAPEGQWSQRVQAAIVDGRAFAHPYHEDGALRDVLVGASADGVVVRGRITGCTPAAVIEVAGLAGRVERPAQAGPFELLLPSSFQNAGLTISLREPTGQVARVTRRVTPW